MISLKKEAKTMVDSLTSEINHLVKLQKYGRINYHLIAELKLPLGSGAMESLIRQAVNLRLKGNGKFWRQHNAESLLHCRCQWLSGGWNAFALGDFNSSHISQLCLIFLSARFGLYRLIKNLYSCR